MSTAQINKQEAERVRREQAAKVREELEMLRERTKALEAENERLAEEAQIWKNAQTAASAMQDEMNKLRASAQRLKDELATQRNENAKLKREKNEVRDEIKRMKALVTNAEKARAAPSAWASGGQQMPNDGQLGGTVEQAQQQLVAAMVVQRAAKRWKERRLNAGVSAARTKQLAMAAARAKSMGIKVEAKEESDKAKSTANANKGSSMDGEDGDISANNNIASLSGGGGAKDLACGKFEASVATFSVGFSAAAVSSATGLEGYIGSPFPDVANAIEREHQSDEVFSSHNVSNTTPKKEYLYVTRMEVGALPDRRQDASQTRASWQLDDFVQHDKAREAHLVREEVLALRLYTGPMYVIYNNKVLRKGAKGQCVTTLHAINSGILKLSKLRTPATVYRAVAGGVLPSNFFEPDGNGAVGGVEAGFMSTTLDRDVALDSAQRKSNHGRTRPSMLFHIKLGLNDKGGSLEFLSQFPAEKEILMPPLSYLEVVAKPWVEGTTVVVDLRVSSGTGTGAEQTLEQILGKMKRSHIDLLEVMYDNLRFSGAPQRALLSLVGLRHESAGRDASEFYISKSYRAATERALAAQQDVMAALGEKTSWDGEPGTPEEVAARMMKVVTLQARAGQYDFATQLLFQAIERETLPSELEAKIATAERSLDKVAGGDRAIDVLKLEDADRKLLNAAALLFHRGATPPWPPLIVSLLNAMGERAQRVFGAVMSSIDPVRTRPTFPPNTPVVVWAAERHKWEDGVVRGAKGRGMYEVQVLDRFDTALVPMRHVLRPSEGGPGAVLYEAARRGSYSVLDALLKGGISPMECDMKANTSLHFAVRRGHAAMCKRLLATGADAEVQNHQGVSAWDLALQNGHANVRRIFAPSAADRDLSKPVDAKGGTPLLLACQAGDITAVTVALSEHQEQLDDVWKSGGTSALMLASRRGDVDIVELLLKASASAATRSRRGTSALSMAAEEGRTAVVVSLLAAGAEVDQTDDDGYTALGIACENGHSESARALLAARSDPNLQRKNGWTSLITASYNGYLPVVKVLSDGGAKANLAKDNGYNAVIAAAYNGFDDVVVSLLEGKAAPDSGMKNGWNALMIAAAQGQAAAVGVLCEAGASIDYSRPANGFSPLMAAVAASEDSTCANILLQHRASVDLTDKQGSTALMHASWHGHIGAVEVLLQANANPATRRLGGTTALMDAASGGHEKVLSLLIAAKADADQTDSRGFTALMHAAKAGNDTAMVPLLKANASVDSKDQQGKVALAHAVTAEAVNRLLEAGADPRGRKGMSMPEPRPRSRPVPSEQLLEELRRGAHRSEEGTRDGKGKASGTGDGNGSTGEDSGKGKGSSAKAKPASPWSLGVDTAQKKKDVNTPKSSKKEGDKASDPKGAGVGGRGAGVGRGRGAKEVVKLFQTAAERMDPVEERRHNAAQKLQSVFREGIARKLRAESQLFAMFKMCEQTLSNHWDDPVKLH